MCLDDSSEAQQSVATAYQDASPVLEELGVEVEPEVHRGAISRAEELAGHRFDGHAMRQAPTMHELLEARLRMRKEYKP